MLTSITVKNVSAVTYANVASAFRATYLARSRKVAFKNTPAIDGEELLETSTMASP